MGVSHRQYSMKAYIKTIDELQSVPNTYKQIFANKFTNSISKHKILEAKYSGEITDLDVDILVFLFESTLATAEQVRRYLLLSKKIEKKVSVRDIENRMNKLLTIYHACNKFMLSQFEETHIEKDSLLIYCLDLGGAYLLPNYSDIPMEDYINWRPLTANVHSNARHVFRDIFLTELRLKLLEVFGDKLNMFRCYQRLTCEKTLVVTDFDFCIEHLTDKKYFTGEIWGFDEIILKSARQADGLEKILSTNAWKKYYYDTEKPPILFLFVESEADAFKLGEQMALRNLPVVRYATIDGVMNGELSEIFLSYNAESKELISAPIELFQKKEID